MTEEKASEGRRVWGIGSYAVAWAVGVQGFPSPASPMGPADLVDLAAEMGVPMVQICDNIPLHEMDDQAVKVLATRAAEAGVNLEIGARTYLSEPLLAHLRVAAGLRSPLVRTLLSGPAAGSTELIPEAEASLRRVLPEFEKAGVALAIENYEGYSSSELAGLIDRIGSPFLGVCLDTVNSLGALEPLDRVVETLAPYALSFHLKDFRIHRHPHMMGFEIIGAEPGTGRLDFRHILEQIRDAGREPSVVLELWPPRQSTADETIALERCWLSTGVRVLRDLMSQ